MDCIILHENYDTNLLINDYKTAVKESEFIKRTYPKGASVSLYKNTIGWSSIPLHSWNGLEGNEGNILRRIDNKVFKPTSILKKCKYFQKILNDLNTDIYLVRMMKLDAGGYIAPHNDGVQFNNRYKMIRCCIPIITNELVFFGINDKEYNLKKGHLYYTRVDKTHWVKNNSDQDRIHLVIDIKPTKEMIKKLKIYNDDYYYIKDEWKKYTVWKELNKKSKTLYISFSGLGINWKPTFIFYNTLSSTNYNRLFIRDTSCQWYLNGIPDCSKDVETTVEYLRKKIIESKCENVIMIGCSAGGFGALLYGCLLNVNKIIVFNPQTYLDDKSRKLNNDNRWCNYKKLKLLQKNKNKFINLQNLNKCDSIIKIVYSDNAVDTSHFDNIFMNKNLNITGEKINCKKHLLAIYLKGKKKLKEYLEI